MRVLKMNSLYTQPIRRICDMNRLLKNPGLLVLFTVAAGGLQNRLAAADATQKHTPFVTVLMRNWDKWDTNHDGELSVPEIDKVVSDPSVKGDDAAVAGTLKLMSRSRKITVPRLTRDYFAQYDVEALAHPVKTSAAAAESATTDTGAAGAGNGPALPVPATARHWTQKNFRSTGICISSPARPASQKAVVNGPPHSTSTMPARDNSAIAI
jgi:hypothetical protein